MQQVSKKLIFFESDSKVTKKLVKNYWMLKRYLEVTRVTKDNKCSKIVGGYWKVCNELTNVKKVTWQCRNR